MQDNISYMTQLTEEQCLVDSYADYLQKDKGITRMVGNKSILVIGGAIRLTYIIQPPSPLEPNFSDYQRYDSQ